MKPKIICHVMASVDGRLQVERWTKPWDEESRGELMSTYAEMGRTLQTDAWTFGRNTVCDIFPDSFSGDDIAERQPKVYAAGRKSKRMFISFDPEADIVYSTPSLRGDDILAVVPADTASWAYLAYLRDSGVSYLVVDSLNDMRPVLEAINGHFGITAISLQGGGLLDGGMLNSNVIDELSVVVYPGLDTENDSVSLFDGKDAESIASTRLKLISVQALKHGAVWLRYALKY